MPLLLTAFRDRNDFTIDELVAVARDLIQEASISQARWKVTEFPDARTVRYYMTTGLLPKPASYEGTAARFDYDHLLRLLAIKALQARFLPLQKIKEIIGAKQGEELERIIKEALPGVQGGRQAGNRKSPTANLENAPGPVPAKTARRAAALDLADLPLSTSSPPPPVEDDSLTWERLEVEGGLELHVRSDFRSPKSPSGVNALLSKIRGILELRTNRSPNAEEDDETRSRARG